MSSRWSARAAATGLGCLVVLVTSGCGSTEVASPERSTAFTAAPSVPVLQPGRPGEPTTVVAPGEGGSLANPGYYAEEDVRFVTDMVGHHAQALQMAALAPERAQDERVRAMASRIEAGQEPEIEMMQAWLVSVGLPEAPTDAGHADHGAMPGMASAADLTRLVAAQGHDFDVLFLQLMTAHHEGALVMAEDGAGAQHPVVSALVDDVIATQSAEIYRMQEISADLGA